MRFPVAKTSRASRRIVTLGFARVQASLEPLPGIQREKLRDVLAKAVAEPMRGGDADMQHDGLFGDGQFQKELFR
jgi:hypothetical protein